MWNDLQQFLKLKLQSQEVSCGLSSKLQHVKVFVALNDDGRRHRRQHGRQGRVAVDRGRPVAPMKARNLLYRRIVSAVGLIDRDAVTMAVELPSNEMTSTDNNAFIIAKSSDIVWITQNLLIVIYVYAFAVDRSCRRRFRRPSGHWCWNISLLSLVFMHFIMFYTHHVNC